MPGKVLGRECVFARNTGTYANIVWNTVGEAIDVNVKDSATKGDVSSRASPFKKHRRGLRDLEITGGIRYDSADDDHIFMQAAYANGALVDWFVADGPPNTNTTQGMRLWGQITEFSHDQPLEDGVKVNFAISPSNDTTNTQDPTWWTTP